MNLWIFESPDDADNRLRWALGSEASPQNITEFSRRFGCPVFEGYGSSENAVVISPGPGTPAAAMGRPQPGIDVGIVVAEAYRRRGIGRRLVRELVDVAGITQVRCEVLSENRVVLGWLWRLLRDIRYERCGPTLTVRGTVSRG